MAPRARPHHSRPSCRRFAYALRQLLGQDASGRLGFLAAAQIGALRDSMHATGHLAHRRGRRSRPGRGRLPHTCRARPRLVAGKGAGCWLVSPGAVRGKTSPTRASNHLRHDLPGPLQHERQASSGLYEQARPSSLHRLQSQKSGRRTKPAAPATRLFMPADRFAFRRHLILSCPFRSPAPCSPARRGQGARRLAGRFPAGASPRR